MWYHLVQIGEELLARVVPRRLREVQIEELASEIVGYARLNATNGHGDALIEVHEVAFRLRETPDHVRQSLRLLQKKGIATKTRSRNHWKLAA